MEKYEKDILEKARKLDRLEREYLKLMYEKGTPEDKQEILDYFDSLFNLGWEAFEIKNEILSEYPHITNIQIHDTVVKKVLDRIRANDTFLSISFYTNISDEINKKRKKEDPKYSTTIFDFFSDQTDELFEEFHSRHHFMSYFEDIMTIGPVISASKIPSEARYYFDEIREAYALKLYASCIALCRAMIEMCLFDKLEKRGLFRDDKFKIVSIDTAKQDKLFYFIGMARRKKILNREMEKLAHETRMSANKILHPKKKGEKQAPKRKEVLNIIFDAIKVIEHIYR